MVGDSDAGWPEHYGQDYTDGNGSTVTLNSVANTYLTTGANLIPVLTGNLLPVNAAARKPYHNRSWY